MTQITIFCLAALIFGGCNSNLKTKHSTSSIGLLQVHQIDSNNFELFLRAFKEERVLEIWAKSKAANSFTKIQSYDFCTSSGDLGPKRKEGDLQIPEGCYFIDRFNPNSSFHLSLGINYPNDADRILGHPQTPGGDIFIHGGCASVGCIPITNVKIEELYALASQAKEQGQQKIQVHIFPSKKMHTLSQTSSPHQALWRQLAPIYEYFETEKKLPRFWIKKDGEYAILK